MKKNINNKLAGGAIAALLASTGGTAAVLDAQHKDAIQQVTETYQEQVSGLQEKNKEDKAYFHQAKLILHERYKNKNLTLQEQRLWVKAVETNGCFRESTFIDIRDKDDLLDRLNESLLTDC